MNKEKLLYEAPTALTFEVRLESTILTLSDSVNTYNRTQYLLSGDDYDYEDL